MKPADSVLMRSSDTQSAGTTVPQCRVSLLFILLVYLDRGWSIRRVFVLAEKEWRDSNQNRTPRWDVHRPVQTPVDSILELRGSKANRTGRTEELASDDKDWIASIYPANSQVNDQHHARSPDSIVLVSAAQWVESGLAQQLLFLLTPQGTMFLQRFFRLGYPRNDYNRSYG